MFRGTAMKQCTIKQNPVLATFYGLSLIFICFEKCRVHSKDCVYSLFWDTWTINSELAHLSFQAENENGIDCNHSDKITHRWTFETVCGGFVHHLKGKIQRCIVLWLTLVPAIRKENVCTLVEESGWLTDMSVSWLCVLN